MLKRMFLLVFALSFSCASAFAMCGTCGSEAGMKEGVKEITYEQFMTIRDSGEGYALLDVLPAESYSAGHIEGAESFPLDTINEASAGQRLSKDAQIIVYCGSFQCSASTQAAQKLSALGYNVLDYKGGLKDWQEKGSKLSP
ncbi:MAG: rhodanese-like domain-containing protein [Candidatus Omnitrophota bacterium]